jgi:hypothetical protein
VDRIYRLDGQRWQAAGWMLSRVEGLRVERVCEAVLGSRVE